MVGVVDGGWKKEMLIIDDAKLSVGVCQHSIWPWPSENRTY